MRKWAILAFLAVVLLMFATNRIQTSDDIAVSAVSAIPVESAKNTKLKDTEDRPMYQVVKVIDGDTITVYMNGKAETVRLIGLDTPETVDPRKPVQCFGKQASDKAKEILSGKRARLEMDPSQGEVDKYGRTLAYIFLEDGTLFNQLMISEGYGHEYTYNPSTGADTYPIGLPYKYQQEFKAAEEAARERKKGLWAQNVCESLP